MRRKLIKGLSSLLFLLVAFLLPVRPVLACHLQEVEANCSEGITVDFYECGSWKIDLYLKGGSGTYSHWTKIHHETGYICGCNPHEILQVDWDELSEGAINPAVDLAEGTYRVKAILGGFDSMISDPFGPCPPTSVTLAEYSLSPGKGGIQIEWTTGTEFNNLGFNIWRSRSNDINTARKINSELIPAQGMGGVGGASYEYLDSSAKPGVVYHYWLEDVEISDALWMEWHYLGSQSWHAPKAVRVYPASGGEPALEPQRFNVTFRDQDRDLQTLYLLVADTPETDGVMVRYEVEANLISLYDPRTQSWSAGLTPGEKAGVNMFLGGLRAGSSRVRAGGEGEYLTVGWLLRFWRRFEGTHNLYGRAVDAAGNDTGWQLLGNWTVE